MEDERTPLEAVRETRAALAELEKQIDALDKRGMLPERARTLGGLEMLHRRLEGLETLAAKVQE